MRGLAPSLGILITTGLVLMSAGLVPAHAASEGAATKSALPADEEDEVVKMGALRGYRLGDLEWAPGPFPASKIAVLAGDPKTGMHHVYLKLADGTAVPPHWHSSDEYVTVVSGTVLLGVGETADRGATRLFGPGAFVWIPAKTPHYVFAKGEVVLSQTRGGAVDFNWVNPADNPANKKETAAGAAGK